MCTYMGIMTMQIFKFERFSDMNKINALIFSKYHLYASMKEIIRNRFVGSFEKFEYILHLLDDSLDIKTFERYTNKYKKEIEVLDEVWQRLLLHNLAIMIGEIESALAKVPTLLFNPELLQFQREVKLKKMIRKNRH
jgi:hypothetical protein